MMRPSLEVLKTLRAILARGQADCRYEGIVESGEGRTFDTVNAVPKP